MGEDHRKGEGISGARRAEPDGMGDGIRPGARVIPPAKTVISGDSGVLVNAPFSLTESVNHSATKIAF